MNGKGHNLQHFGSSYVYKAGSENKKQLKKASYLCCPSKVPKPSSLFCMFFHCFIIKIFNWSFKQK